MAKSNKIIKLAAFALIGYGVYKVFFAEDNDVYATTYSGANASRGPGSSRGYTRNNKQSDDPSAIVAHVSDGNGGTRALTQSEYDAYNAQKAAERQQKIAELTERLETSTDESEKVAIQRQLNSLRSTTSHR